MAQVVETVPHGKQEHMFILKSIPWLLMIKWSKKPGHSIELNMGPEYSGFIPGGFCF